MEKPVSTVVSTHELSPDPGTCGAAYAEWPPDAATVDLVTAPRPEAPVDAERSMLADGPVVGVDTLPAVVLELLVTGPSRAVVVRVLVSAVVGPVLAGYAVVVALVTLLSSTAGVDWSPATTLRAAAPLWLAAHQVPLTITVPGGMPAPLGALPLLPTLGLAVLVARAAAGATARLDLRTPARLAGMATVFAAVHAALGAAIAFAEPTTRMTASPVAAAAGCATVAWLAALWGGLRAVGFSSVALAVLPAWAVRGVLAGLSGLVGLLAAGAVCTFAALAFSAGTVREVLASWSGAAGGQFGVTALSVAYLPNAIVGALSWAAGPGLSIGAVSVTPFGTSVGDLPAVPLLAALPESGPAPWRALVFALPLLAGVLVARRCRRLGGDPTERLNAVVTAAATAAVGCFALAVLAGGRLGGGAFDPVRVPSASLALAVFVWIVLPAGLIVGLTYRPARVVEEAGSGYDEPDDDGPGHDSSGQLEPGDLGPGESDRDGVARDVERGGERAPGAGAGDAGPGAERPPA